MKNKKQMNIVFTDEFFEDGKKAHSFKDEVVDYSIYSEMDDLEINGNSAFVIANDVENKKLIVEYVDSGEMETIDYSKPIYKSKDSTPKSKDLTPKNIIKYYTVKDALSTMLERGTISRGKGSKRWASDKEMMEVTLNEYWNYNALRNVGWSVFFTSSGQSLEFLDKADAEEYIERKGLNDISDQFLSKGGSLDNIKLLAPNGNPSNLTPEQYSLVRTDAFKKWFGDWENDPENSSKVIDKNGEPLQQSHFTNAKFTKFKNKESGFHFGDKSIKGDLSIAKGGDLYEELVVFLNIRNPLRVKDSHRFDPSILIEQLSNDNVISSEQYDKLSEDLYDVEENLTEDESYDDWALINKQSDILIKVLNGLGYDGLIYENKFDSQDSKLAYLIDEDSSQIYVRNNDGVFVGDVVLESESSKRALINFVSHNGNLYVIEEDNGEELTELNKKRIKEIIDLGGFVKVFDSPKTYTDVDLFLGQKSFLDSWVAFEPNQIKLADGKNTKFDGGKSDIRFEDGGGIKTSSWFSGELSFLNW